MARRRTTRQVEGVVPRFFRALGGALGWILVHPQPLLIAGVLALIGAGMWRFIAGSDSFRVEHVSVPPSVQLALPDGIEGRNIWEVDIASLSRGLHAQQPWLERVRIIRRLPDTILVEPIPRIPVAQLQLSSWLAVDDKGFILPGDKVAAGEGLPKLVGFQKAGANLKSGSVNDDATLQQALRVLKVLQTSPVLAGRRVEEVDVGDGAMIRFRLDGDVEIRCGREVELGQHLERLDQALKAIAERAIDVRYIDVRFNEPVVAPREA